MEWIERMNACLLYTSLNYRCAPDILRRAQMCISHNPGPARVLRPAAKEGAPVRLVRADTAFSEAVWIAKEVSRLAGGVDMLAASATEGEMRAFSEMAVPVSYTHLDVYKRQAQKRPPPAGTGKARPHPLHGIIGHRSARGALDKGGKR